MVLSINSEPVSPNIPIWEVSVQDTQLNLDRLVENINNKGEKFTEGRFRYNVNFLDNSSNSNSLYNPSYILNKITSTVTDNGNTKRLYPAYNNSKYNFSMKEYLTSKLGVIYFGVKDNPKFKMEPHFDNRGIFGNLIINLKDNTDGTSFYNYSLKGNLETKSYCGPTEKGKGVFFLNSEETLHSVENTSKEDRFVLNIAIVINSLI